MGEQERCEDVDCVDAVEFLGGDGALVGVVEGLVGGYAGVVDEDIDLEGLVGLVLGLVVLMDLVEELFGCGEDFVYRGGGIGEVGLEGEAVDGVGGGELGAEVVGWGGGGVGCVGDEEVGAFGGEAAGDCFADAWGMSAGDG